MWEELEEFWCLAGERDEENRVVFPDSSQVAVKCFSRVEICCVDLETDHSGDQLLGDVTTFSNSTNDKLPFIALVPGDSFNC